MVFITTSPLDACAEATAKVRGRLRGVAIPLDPPSKGETRINLRHPNPVLPAIPKPLLPVRHFRQFPLWTRTYLSY